MSTFIKDPDAVLDWRWDWDPWLEDGETITSHELLPDGVEVESSSVQGGEVVGWLSGGTLGRTARVTCRVTTSKGRTDDRTIRLLIRDR